MNRDFVHLRVHTDFSLLESNVKIPALAQKLVELEMPGCAVTDKGNLYGMLSLYNAFKAQNLKPVFGYQAFLTLASRHDRVSNLKAGESAYYELSLLATNLRGYQNLIQLSSKAFTEGFFHKPRIDCELLAQHSDGLIALTGGLKGLTGHFLKHNRFEIALEKINLLRDIFGAGQLFLEIQDHDLDEEKSIRRQLIELSTRSDVPLVATNDVHYLTAADASAHEVLLCIGSGQTINDASRPNFGSKSFHLRSAAEMWRIFGTELPAALRRTKEIFERCQPELPKANDKDYLPRYPIPPESNCSEIDEYFEQITWEGFAARKKSVWDVAAQSNRPIRFEIEVYRQRLQKEIEIIKQMGYPGYFLIVWDFVKFARQNEIPVGPGRGSAAGSLVAYCLEITDIDPIEYDLLFERFLNPERVSMPDIDIDFCVRGRDAVIQHVINRYGRECVCQIITFGTMASKAVIKDVGRALAVPYPEVEKIAKLIPPPVRGRNVSISQALEQVPELQTLASTSEQAGNLIDLARRLEGCARHTSVHAAGIVIAPCALNQLIPVATSPKSELTTQFAMADLEKTGMLKMDFLALTTLTVISDCLKSLKQIGVSVKWEIISLDDPATMQVFGEGRTDAIFQFESPGMQEICRRLKPKSIEDLSALNALYRPGPLDGGMVDDFISRHRGEKSVRYIVPQMKEILSNTLGILVYQEQIMQLAQQLAGYSLGEADLMRRAMGKKKREEMAQHTDKFVSGATARGIKQEKAEQIFNLMAQFADYGFNRSHSVAYAYLAFQTAYLKAHYPAHFYAAVLSHEAQDAAKIYKYAIEIQEVGLKLLPPDINESAASFTPLNNSIRFGLSAIKGLGENSIHEIITARARSPFASLFDFTARLASGGVNRRGLENLISAGAFDSFNHENLPLTEWRSRLVAAIDSALAFAKKQQQDVARGQHGLFAATNDDQSAAAAEPTLPAVAAWSSQEVWKAEKQAMGFYLTSHPLDGAEDLIAEMAVTPISDLAALVTDERDEKPKIWTAGVISNLQIRVSKKGTNFAILKLEDRTGNLKCLIWEEAFNKFRDVLQEDQIVFVSGALELENENTLTLIADKILPLAEAKPGKACTVLITPPAQSADPLFWENLLGLLHRHQGKCQVMFEIECQTKLRVRLQTNNILGVRGSTALENEFKERGCQVQWHLVPPPLSS